MTKAKDSVEIHLIVDRLEDGKHAVLTGADDEKLSIDFPISLLPDDTTDGDHLKLRITRDATATEAATAKTQELLERLESRTTPAGKKDFKL
jgi:hypothetical protein